MFFLCLYNIRSLFLVLDKTCFITKNIIFGFVKFKSSSNFYEMTEITDLFVKIISDIDSIDMAEAEFKKMVAEDDELKKLYVEWCNENGSSFRNGFLDFCEEYIENRNSVWDSLTDHDE